MEKTFSFQLNTTGNYRKVSFNAPVNNWAVITNRFCPQSLLRGNGPLASIMEAMNGEAESDFVNDCQTQVSYINQDSKSERYAKHVNALSSAVRDHVNRCGRLIFNDLLIYADCFAYLLLADGYRETDIVNVYPKEVLKIVKQYGATVKNSVNLTPLMSTPIYNYLINESNK